eukprot:TRINITY_DN13312_c0_g1_i1.p1 TRINITY_DN13312_c0_g1~~TRINITY_DN13312_c0_g1_i1.p1  ORF type:complete len:602 (+),score=61.42 TRINITY_DN13312_c0_g1_i1:3-1808(+)
MRFLVFSSLLIICSCFILGSAFSCPRKAPPKSEIHPVATTTLHKLPIHKLPSEFHWGNASGKNLLTPVQSQNNPQYCCSGWAHSVVSSLSDRIKIQRNGTWPDVRLSPQPLLSCDSRSDGCVGGSPISALQYIYENDISDESCSPYQGFGRTNGKVCSPEIICSDCSGYKCTPSLSYLLYGISEFGEIHGEFEMMNEIIQRGPIVCGIAPRPNFIEYTSGILNDEIKTKVDELEHAVSIVGWGEHNGTKYWVVKNSWGSFWGEDGYAKIVRGTNAFGIESECVWGVPKSSPSRVTKVNKELNGLVFASRKSACYHPLGFSFPFPTPSKEPRHMVDLKKLPKTWDWRNINGTNFVSPATNQDSPRKCGACWVQATLSAIADRINIYRNNTFPTVSLSAQEIINCKAGGDCAGGKPDWVFQHGQTEGFTEESCQRFAGANPDKYECSQAQRCSQCQYPVPSSESEAPKSCAAVKKYRKWYIKEFGTVTMTSNMKAEIMVRGPITCSLQTTAAFEKYKGHEVFSEKTYILKANHLVSVVGWDVDEQGHEHWIARNTWGTGWGDHGFFRIATNKQNLGIEMNCYWAVPDLSRSQRKSVFITSYEI